MSVESPYVPPKSPLIDTHNGKIHRKGRYVVLTPDTEWPSRCFKCNETTPQKLEVKLAYINPWIYLSILINLLLTIILAAIFQKRFTMNLPLCEKHRRKRKILLIVHWLLLAVIVAAIFLGFSTGLMFFAYIAIPLSIILILSALLQGRLAFAAKFKDDNLWISGAGKDFLDSLPVFSE